MKQKSIILNVNIVFLVLIICGFLVGVMFPFLFEEKMIVESDILNQDFLLQFNHMEIDKRALLFLCIKKRLGAFFLVWMLSYSSVNKFFAGVLIFIKSIYVGSMMEILALRYGIKGLWMYLALVSPQGIFYFLGLWLLGIWCFEKTARSYKKLYLSSERENRKILIAFILTILGVALESYINPEILKFIFEKI